MRLFKDALRALLRRAGWTVHRWPAHRFEAMEDALRVLRMRGFSPDVVVDIGANVGTWTRMAAALFDAREYHLVEPQPGCQDALKRFHAPRFIVHPLALTRANVPVVRLIGVGPTASDTGASVVEEAGAGSPGIDVPALTLDGLLGGRFTASDRVLLKLDVEAHELAVLGGGTRVLAASEVVILEIKLFPSHGSRQPTLFDVMAFMRGHGFELHDMAALASRPRDLRLRGGDAIFVRSGSPLAADTVWE